MNVRLIGNGKIRRLVTRDATGQRCVVEINDASAHEETIRVFSTGLVPGAVRTLHAVRHPGLGDKVFALAALWAFKQQRPEVDIYFDTWQEWRPWVERVPFVRFGRPQDEAHMVDFDHIPANAGDRCCLFGRLLGIQVCDIRFPVRLEKPPAFLPTEYIVLAPWCGPWRLRDLPEETIRSLLQDKDWPFVVLRKEPNPYPTIHIDLTGEAAPRVDMLWDIIAGAKAVIGVDTGITWMGAALGRPTLAFMGHVPPEDRVMTCKTVRATAATGSCPQYPCGDHGAPPAPCGATSNPQCMKVYTPEVVKWQIQEFISGPITALA